MESNETYRATDEDIRRVKELAQHGPATAAVDDAPATDYATADVDAIPADIDYSYHVSKLLQEMAQAAFAEDKDKFAKFSTINFQRIRDAALFAPEVVEMLVLGYKIGISKGSFVCMNDLGAMYYKGELVEQDYQKAADLYEMAADMGCVQSIINLGYIYEYGRIGKPDYQKAFQCYSFAAALSKSSEATYKLGDLYKRGRGVPQDTKKAYLLYEQSYKLAIHYVQAAHPALRLADLLISPDEIPGVPYDPERALELYMRAEIGLRKDIADGQTYYERQLQRAIEGQERARNELDLFGGGGLD